MTQQDDGLAGKGLAHEHVDDMCIADEILPAVLERQVPGMRGLTAVSAVIVDADDVAALRCRRRESRIAISMFAETMEDLYDGADVPGRLEDLHVNHVIVCGG